MNVNVHIGGGSGVQRGPPTGGLGFGGRPPKGGPGFGGRPPKGRPGFGGGPHKGWEDGEESSSEQEEYEGGKRPRPETNGSR